MRARIMLLGSALAILAGCGGNADNAGGGAPSSSSAGADSAMNACALMREADFASVISGAVTISEQPSASSKYIKVTNCAADGPDAKVTIGLLMREHLSDDTVSPAAAQAQTLIDSAEKGGMLAGMTMEPVEGLGEAAMWIPQIGQLNVFYRGGSAHFIVTAMNAPDNKAAAIALAQQILAKHP
jgi:hypothetical protein